MAGDTSTTIPTWGAGRVPHPRVGLGASLVAAAVLLLAALAAATTTVVVGLLVAVVLASVAAAWIVTRGRAALRSAGAVEVPEGAAPRLEALVKGVAADLGIAAPTLHKVESTHPNAMVVWAAGAHVCVTTALLEGFSLTELEAVVTQCLVRIASGEARATTFALGLGPLAPPTWPSPQADVATAAVTRYPPALATALRKAGPHRGWDAALWFAPEPGTPAAERAEAVADL